VVDPPLPEPRAELVERRELGGAPDRHPYRRAVGEAVLADHVQRHQLQLALDRPPGLAEQVPHDSGEQRVRRARVPGEAVLGDRGQRAAEGGGPLDQRDVVAELREAHGGGQATEATAHHHDPHGR